MAVITGLRVDGPPVGAAAYVDDKEDIRANSRDCQGVHHQSSGKVKCHRCDYTSMSASFFLKMHQMFS